MQHLVMNDLLESETSQQNYNNTVNPTNRPHLVANVYMEPILAKYPVPSVVVTMRDVLSRGLQNILGTDSGTREVFKLVMAEFLTAAPSLQTERHAHTLHLSVLGEIMMSHFEGEAGRALRSYT